MRVEPYDFPFEILIEIIFSMYNMYDVSPKRAPFYFM